MRIALLHLSFWSWGRALRVSSLNFVESCDNSICLCLVSVICRRPEGELGPREGTAQGEHEEGCKGYNIEREGKKSQLRCLLGISEMAATRYSTFERRAARCGACMA